MTNAPETTTREKIVRTAQRLLAQSGLSGAGLNQVIAASGAPRGSIYYHFPEGKMQWVKEALDAYGEYFCAMANDMLSRKGSFGENLETLLLTMADGMTQTQCSRGCPIGAVILDLDESSEILREVCVRAISRWQAVFERHLSGIAAARRRQLAGFLISAIEGALMLSRMEGNSHPLRSTATMLRRLVESELAA